MNDTEGKRITKERRKREVKRDTRKAIKGKEVCEGNMREGKGRGVRNRGEARQRRRKRGM